MTSAFQSGHQRTSSQAQQLISKSFGDDEFDCEATSSASPYDSRLIVGERHQTELPSTARADTNAMRFSTLSECSSYYGLPGSLSENETRNPYLRANVGVVIGSALLTLVGAVILAFGLYVLMYPNEMDIHGWIFLVVGTLFFIPGIYHITFIVCVLCNRPGYSFDNLPTFSKPQP